MGINRVEPTPSPVVLFSSKTVTAGGGCATKVWLLNADCTAATTMQSSPKPKQPGYNDVNNVNSDVEP